MGLRRSVLDVSSIFHGNKVLLMCEFHRAGHLAKVSRGGPEAKAQDELWEDWEQYGV